LQLPLLPLPKTLSSFPTLDEKRERKRKNSSLRIISIRFSADLDPAAPRVVIADGYLIKLEFCLMLFLIQSLLLHLLYFYFLRICLNPPFHFQADFVTIQILSSPDCTVALYDPVVANLYMYNILIFDTISLSKHSFNLFQMIIQLYTFSSIMFV